MVGFIKDKIDKFDEKVVQATATKIVDDGVNIVKDGVVSTASAIIWKIAIGIIVTVLFVVSIISGGCIGTTLVVDKIKTEGK